MTGEEENGEKSHEPSQKKLDDARTKGEIPRSADLITASTYGGLLVSSLVIGGVSFSSTTNVFANLLDRADSLSAIWFKGSSSHLFGLLIQSLIWPLSVWFVLPFIAAVVTIIAQRAFVISSDKVHFKLERISIISNAKNKFGRSGIFDFTKSTIKLAIYCFVLGIILYKRIPDIISTIEMPPSSALSKLFKISIEFLVVVLAVSLFIGVIDFIWQYQEHIRKNRMSYKEIVDENKQMEGDPHVKHQRRQRGYEIAMNQMLKEVPRADVIIVNPKHYAVALKWDRLVGQAPICVAKGVDEIAARIRGLATDADVPIYQDAPTARALYASVEIGDQIRPDHYRAVAAAIRFAESLRVKIRDRHL